MKVIYVSNKGETGGAARSQMAMIETLVEKHGIEPIVLTYSKGKLSELCDELGIENYPIAYEPFMIGGGSTLTIKIAKRLLLPYYVLKRKMKNYLALKQCEKLVDLKQVDLVHTNTNRDDFGAILAKKYNIPHIWHIREFGDKDYECIFLRRNAIKYMNSVKGCYIAISQAVKDAWIKKGLNERDIKLVYNGIDKALYDTTSFHDNKREKMRIIFTGTIYENKGQIQALKAIEQLPEEIRSSISIDFYGGGAKAYINKLKKWCETHRISKQVRFCGFSNNLNEILPQYDVALVCSKAEGFGRVTVEHMLSGLVVIASDSGANPEIITSEKNGFLYESENIQSLSECIKKVYEMRFDMNQIVANARTTVLNRFTKEINAEGVYQIYQEVKTR